MVPFFHQEFSAANNPNGAASACSSWRNCEARRLRIMAAISAFNHAHEPILKTTDAWSLLHKTEFLLSEI
jgi:hypothetical protein